MDAAGLRLRHILSRADAVVLRDDLARLSSVRGLLQDHKAPASHDTAAARVRGALLGVRRVLRRASRTRARVACALLLAAAACALYGWLWWWPEHRNRQVGDGTVCRISRHFVRNAAKLQKHPDCILMLI